MQGGGVEPGRAGIGWSVRAVKPDGGVEVDQAAALVFGDLPGQGGALRAPRGAKQPAVAAAVATKP